VQYSAVPYILVEICSVQLCPLLQMGRHPHGLVQNSMMTSTGLFSLQLASNALGGGDAVASKTKVNTLS
jgi:hypothetical protein